MAAYKTLRRFCVRSYNQSPCSIIPFIFLKNEHHFRLPIDTSLLADLIKILEVGDFRAKFSATLAITNLISGGDAGQVFKLVELGGLKPFCNMLGCNDVLIIRVRYFQ